MKLSCYQCEEKIPLKLQTFFNIQQQQQKLPKSNQFLQQTTKGLSKQVTRNMSFQLICPFLKVDNPANITGTWLERFL